MSLPWMRVPEIGLKVIHEMKNRMTPSSILIESYTTKPLLHLFLLLTGYE
jgi:hypothetical protein